MRWLSFCAGVLLLCSCGPAPADHLSRAQSPIVGGVDDPGDPEVVAFTVAGWPECTATLVAPRTALTAGHCANLIGQSDQYAIAFGEDASHPTQSVKVISQVLHPQYTAEGAPYDFALLELDQPVSGVAPARIATAALTDADVGRTIRHVGFGVSDELAGTGRGTRRQVSYPITEVDPYVVWSGGPGEQTCNGDSGGPGFVARDGGEELAAVVSDGPNCHDAGWDGRVDVVADWIAQTESTWEIDAGAPDAGPPADAPGGGCASSGGADWSAVGAMLLAVVLLGRKRRCR